MFSLLRNRFGIPGVISVIALVFAMLGGAYAANNSGGGKATASAKGKPGPRGKTGKTGPAGPAGPAGPQGPAGANGKDGSNGTNGSNGAPGKDGASVKLSAAGACSEGGTKLTVGTESKEVCNGEEGPEGPAGADGKEGSPWTLGGTLPPGATETGMWGFTANKDDSGLIEPCDECGTVETGVWVPISFPIPLTEEMAFAIGEGDLHYGAGEEEPFAQDCPGDVFHPKAKPGEVCVYIDQPFPPFGTEFNGIFRNTALTPGVTTAGALLNFKPPTEAAIGGGSFAVTGCSEALPVGDPNKCP